MEGPPGSGLPKQDLLFDLRLGPLVGAFLLLAALDHALVALPPCRARYERGLAAGVNPFRWREYSLSASLMAVLIAMLSGIADYVALLALFALNAAMIFLGWLMERSTRRPCADALAAVRSRLRRWRRSMDRDRGADGRLGGAWTCTADVRLRDLRLALRAVQQ